jgi:hypothetical protein
VTVTASLLCVAQAAFPFSTAGVDFLYAELIRRIGVEEHLPRLTAMLRFLLPSLLRPSVILIQILVLLGVVAIQAAPPVLQQVSSPATTEH